MTGSRFMDDVGNQRPVVLRPFVEIFVFRGKELNSEFGKSQLGYNDGSGMPRQASALTLRTTSEADGIQLVGERFLVQLELVGLDLDQDGLSLAFAFGCRAQGGRFRRSRWGR